MTSATGSAHWNRLEQLFYEALARDPAERSSFLDKACAGDAELRKEVESLLASSNQTLGFLKKPIENAAQGVAQKDVGQRIGPYELVGLLGEGGMGEVYLAKRADNLFAQEVAIKLMRPDLTRTDAMVVRFAAERQILANLNHPNIARLLDGGVTTEGAPYLVIEYIKGIPIDAYCRGKKLSIAERLRLFQCVCSALEYAHKNLVVHRDIKPANILVTDDGTPKLLDFGIAKLLTPEHYEHTQTRDRMMTPEYASPEQVRGEVITTATDVYALGVLLYELLSGEQPFHLTTRSPFEAIRVICEEDPPPPSTAAEQTGGAGDEVAAKLRGDLDNIVMMAIQKQPSHRYASVSALSADVQSYLDGYPVRARTGRWTYRSGKFIKRHKATVAAVLTIVVALIGFSIGMAVLARRATRARQTAERETQFLNSIFQASTPDAARGKQLTARDLLDTGARRIDTELSDQPELRATMLDNIGRAYSALGLYDRAESLLQRAYDIRRATSGADSLDTASTLDALATSIRLEDQYQKAEPLFRRSLAIREAKLKPNDALVADSLSNLGECLYWEEQNTEAEVLLRRALEIQRQLGPNVGDSTRVYLAWVLERKGSYPEAAQLLKEAVEITKRTKGVDSPDYLNSLHNYAGTLIDAGDLNAAEAADRQVLAGYERVLGPNHPDLYYSLNNLGYILIEKGEWEQAIPFLQRAYDLRRSLGREDRAVAVSLNNLGRALQEKGDYAGAETDLNESLAMIQRTSGRSSWGAAKITANLGLLQFDRQDYTSAEDYALQALEMRRNLGGNEHPDVASSLMDVAEIRIFQGDAKTAEPMLRKALEIREKKFNPGNPGIIAAQVRLGEALALQGNLNEAEAILRQALASVRSEPFPLPAWQVAEVESALGVCLLAQGKSTEGEDLVRSSENNLSRDPRPAFRHIASNRALALNMPKHHVVARSSTPSH